MEVDAADKGDGSETDESESDEDRDGVVPSSAWVKTPRDGSGGADGSSKKEREKRFREVGESESDTEDERGGMFDSEDEDEESSDYGVRSIAEYDTGRSSADETGVVERAVHRNLSLTDRTPNSTRPHPHRSVGSDDDFEEVEFHQYKSTESPTAVSISSAIPFFSSFALLAHGRFPTLISTSARRRKRTSMIQNASSSTCDYLFTFVHADD